MSGDHNVALILDYGSQYTQLITRRIREVGMFSLLFPGDASLERIQSVNPKVIILSGGPNSVHVEGSPKVPAGFFEYVAENSIPVLGICYGMQLLTHLLGGEVSPAVKGGEYGRMPINIEPNSSLFSYLNGRESINVWMSHGDEAVRLPEGFVTIAKSHQGAVVAIENAQKRLFGFQFHPEVMHTETGVEMISHFLTKIAKVTPDWDMGQVLEGQLRKVAEQVGPDDHAICALSGGVDSTVAAVLVHKVLGDRLHCVFVDNGLLRYDEQNRVMATFREHLHLPVTCVDHSKAMLDRLKGVSDPEAKRKAIGAEFIEVFKAYSHELEAKIGKKPKFLVQGTLYPDVIESCPPPGSGQKHSHTIKSHHNVGGLPKDLQFTLIEPFRELFKDEVRAVGRLLGVPEQFIKRHPFPGPGLAVRVLGDVTDGNKLDTLREVDEIFVNTIREYGLYDEIWQAFAVFLPVKSVGVQGDQRTHSHVVALRAVNSSDGMTADWYSFTPAFLRDVSNRICNKVRSVNRVVYDITSKPPGTIEWE
uniref:GMP synthase [glutamine-hydrolyzing] n=1 Tax=Polytomella parva TaxID=51329 RepID=A0A7S0YS74_9CHLO|eukprot:CAMPEP_0175072132 /NCGR_PEP_ID=MMETSP0052_2-20121109/19705_1 /TAXON_ID=51329 ORGANISM="Polytomella parva, Strain SAG 63-3" /NCGR_SAMPLE_ID=MMETSP0052_2 /ASSEMBLY_ACC=CAM_ASM_000194 /LENGTH=532 /DNA_ID=CAMNT_0016339533 /DNA_START=35 /DNA_END=1633 /DNA_ORIENTATION=-